MSSAASSLSVSCLPVRGGSSEKKQPLPFMPERVFVDREAANHPAALRILSRICGAEVDVIDDVRVFKRPRDLRLAGRALLLTMHRGRAFKPCQGMGEGHLCCGYRVMDLVSGCPMSCSYCILQHYLANNPVTTAYVNLEDMLSQAGEFLDRHPNGFFRIGTGELSDSLALDPILDFAPVLVSFFAGRENALLELKTKTAYVDSLIGLNHCGRTVISWSVNTPEIIASDEAGTASLDERLSAASRAADAGYGVGFHFDPMIMSGSVEETLEGYLAVADRIAHQIPSRSIAWISLGLLRYPPQLSETALQRFPGSKIFTGELVPVGGRMRYPAFLRRRILKPLYDRLKETVAPERLYLCMESLPVWRGVEPAVLSSRCIERRLAGVSQLPNRL